ncbi:hypothetical protein PIB30_026410 [Stylosanthes scabra]|uniref:C2 domain-containing protein n=1 Tax=Stylosanthes scabra TaxID=79078 RepID=A0ABU6SB17_9FABA|nr:hypothetical protein [Stylosanthes scabra]
MPCGRLEVVLISAKDLDGNDFPANTNPYVILSCDSEEHKSTVKEGAGTNPEWNENFVFIVSDSCCELHLKLMDKDGFLGEAMIPLYKAFNEGGYPETCYNVMKNQECCGEIKLALTFNADGSKSETLNLIVSFSTPLPSVSLTYSLTHSHSPDSKRLEVTLPSSHLPSPSLVQTSRKSCRRPIRTRVFTQISSHHSSHEARRSSPRAVSLAPLTVALSHSNREAHRCNDQDRVQRPYSRQSRPSSLAPSSVQRPVTASLFVVKPRFHPSSSLVSSPV